MQLLTLSKMRFLYLAVLCLAVVPAILAIVFWPVLDGHWCRQFQIPSYEKRFGFRLGTFELADAQGRAYPVTGFLAVQPGGLLARAGVRPGDLPRMHHGISSLCSALGLAQEGYSATLTVVNVSDVRAGKREPREIMVPSGAQE
jgi:hypothetical protein